MLFQQKLRKCWLNFSCILKWVAADYTKLYRSYYYSFLPASTLVQIILQLVPVNTIQWGWEGRINPRRDRFTHASLTYASSYFWWNFFAWVSQVSFDLYGARSIIKKMPLTLLLLTDLVPGSSYLQQLDILSSNSCGNWWRIWDGSSHMHYHQECW